LGVKVCVIEDDSLVLLHLEEMLKRLGCQVLTAATVNEGLRIVEDWSPDAVLVDILMPDRDGLNFIMDTRHLRDSMRVIAMSGGGRLASSSILQMATGLGAHAALTKPITEEALRAALEG
jgi:CheY-like chemotaxis protein